VTALFQVIVVIVRGAWVSSRTRFTTLPTPRPRSARDRLLLGGARDSAVYVWLGRVEDFAGLAVILTILASAVVAAYESLQRLRHPQPWTFYGP